ncbi:YceI family protein [Pontibacter pamirensis]|uniref:YceI family protein n=1 Tax=Pontibacter pamirensis TaxID=2562824 RepID=UPI001389E1B1|nr:YceI family protein [Pontibacter pamirensis]
MKRTAIYASFAAALLFTACSEGSTETETTSEVITEATTPADGETYNVVTEQSEVNWLGKKVGGEHTGNIELQNGELVVANDQLVGGTLVIDMNTITNTDITAEEDNQKLVGHLKSDDFFGVEKYPTATFEITNVTPVTSAAAGEATHNVTGNLTIKEKTEQVSFPAVINVNNGTTTAKADVTVDRSKFDVRYGSNSFFDDLGDKAIDDNFTITFDVTAQQTANATAQN